MKRKSKPVSGLIKRPEIVVGGTQHKQATSFMPARIAQYEATKAYREQGIVWVSPTRGVVHTSVVVSWLSLQWPMNQFRSPLIVSEGMEVAAAYNALVSMTINKPRLRKVFDRQFADMFADSPFILTTEEDNVLPGDTVPKLLAAIFTCPDCGKEVLKDNKWRCEKGHAGYSAVSGLYFLKSDPPMPMAYGTPNGSKHIDFRPRSVASAVRHSAVMEVNGIAMGCAIWRKDLFKSVSRPWFKTVPGWTQDLWFCKRAKQQAKARFGVHCGVRVSHFNPHTHQFF